MSPRKAPYRSGYRSELTYPSKAGMVHPSHGCGPRCRVIYDPNDDGPLTKVQIMRIDDDDVENYTCLMPRYYEIPLMLINKQLAFYEAQCDPNGTPLPPSSSCGIKQRREYTYLWHLRCRFLEAVFDLNHERFLNERWRYDGIHGFLHRMYGRFGHDTNQRLAYWREEIKEGRVPYTAPEIAEMDWKAYISEDMTTSTRINAFLWNRVSQGYSRVVKDKPPFESWRAWRAGYRDHKPVPYLTPASSVRELSSELDGVSAAAVAVAVAKLATQGSSSNCGAGGYDTDVRTVTAPPMLAGAPAAAAASSAGSSSSAVTSYSESAATGSHRGVDGVVAGVTGNGDWDEEEEELEYRDYEGGTGAALTTALTGPPNSQEWVLPFPSLSSQSSQLSSSPSGGTGRSFGTRSSSQGRFFRQRQISFKLNAPEDMELAVIQCTLTKRREGVKNKPQLKADYAENLS